MCLQLRIVNSRLGSVRSLGQRSSANVTHSQVLQLLIGRSKSVVVGGRMAFTGWEQTNSHPVSPFLLHNFKQPYLKRRQTYSSPISKPPMLQGHIHDTEHLAQL